MWDIVSLLCQRTYQKRAYKHAYEFLAVTPCSPIGGVANRITQSK